MKDKTEIIPIALFSLTGIIWLLLWIQSHRLLFKFRKKFPDIAERDIPYAFNDAIRHPEKFFYFIKKGNIEKLSKDIEIAKLRRQVVILFRMSYLVPLLGSLLLLIFVLILINFGFT